MNQDKKLFRPHRGGLAESMECALEISDKHDLIKKVKADFSAYDHCLEIDSSTISIEHRGYDERIEWDTYIVRLKGYGVLGYTNCSLSECPANTTMTICDDPDPMTLENDPLSALKEISGYLKCVSVKGREVRDRGGEIEGYWQTPEFLQGCLDIARECDRIVNEQRGILDSVLSHALSDISIPQFEPEGFRSGYLACIEKIKSFQARNSAS